MKKNYLFWVTFIVTTITVGQTIFINEIHYDNADGDEGEGVEIAGPSGTDLSGYKVRFYNQLGNLYGSILHLTGIIPDQQNGLGTLWFLYENIQNGPNDALVLIDNIGNVVQFLSYNGSTTAVEGEATGMTSTDIGVSESDSTPINFSLQLIGEGNDYGDFIWTGPISHTNGLPNTGQTLPVIKNQIEGFSLFPNPVSEGKLFISSRNRIHLKIEIHSMVGKCVYKKEVQFNETIDVSNLTSGIYMVKVKEGSRIAIRKLIVK